MEHLQYALRDQNSDFYILQVDYTGAESERFYKNELLFESLKSRVSIPTTKQKLNDKSNASNVIPRPKHIRKCDLVLLMPIKKFPLSKEQQEFYVLITETCMGASESVRREALQRLQLDSSLQPMAPTLCTFISDAVKVNVVQKNFVLLVYLMRMVHALLGNSNLQLQSYVHLLISSVLSCCVANQLCAYSSAQNHWALREFAAIIMIDILKLFSNVDKSILPRVLRVYKNGLQSAVLPTIYGCAVGLSKLGGYIIFKFIIPQLRSIAICIETQLSKDDDDVDKQAAIFIRHRLLKMCAPILKTIHSAPDMVSEYIEHYGYLGPGLCDAVVLARIIDELSVT
ncbi:transcription initiation factor TFIID subunit 6 isoform X1 [Drosophila busckii]|uniref:transcription initiation factor TFIID subunit 6 isoform X1 n=1 Tax=Drosophila busckii TaxID=30019 RepID=UPI0014329F91|nr:transcription initiation factor TFIID subunit 6 isoform X1 [Drosophila busckii]